MIKEIYFKNWKSFKEAKLYIDPLTVLIGTNASGKSNIIDGINFLNRIANGQDFQTALNGESKNRSIRGGVEWAARKNHKEFTIKALLHKDEIDYIYSITVHTLPQPRLISEALFKITNGNCSQEKNVCLFRTKKINHDKNEVKLEILGIEKLIAIVVPRRSLLFMFGGLEYDNELVKATDSVMSILRNIFILNPVPSHMRSYSPLSDSLNTDASNLAGVIATLPDKEKQEIESVLLKYVTRLPEKDIKKIWAEKVGPLKNDAMLYCEENWADDDGEIIIDAQSMSDGTLRFIAILVAILTLPKNSQLVIEEVDNGLHASRIHLLIEILRDMGKKRNIDILITTHNSTLLTQMGPSMIPFVILTYRSNDDGTSQLILLEDIESLPKLLANGSLGQVNTDGDLERSVHNRKE